MGKSECCKAEVRDGYISGADHDNPVPTVFCTQCGNECIIVDEEVDEQTKDQVDLDLYDEKISSSL